MRIGQGFDVHRFTQGDQVILGGVSIPHTHGIDAHSDGDVLLHAICDALLGAAGLEDIGAHFPDDNAANANRDSREFLRAIARKIETAGFGIENLDATVVLQRPRIRDYIQEMRLNIARDLQIDSSMVNVKATTTEGLGFTGRGEGIAAMAVVLLK